MMDSIGGYFGLELRRGGHYHNGALRLNTARNAFEYVLSVRGYRKVYLPYYTCEAMIQPICRLGLEYSFYHIDEKLEPVDLPDLGDGEAFLYTNYFGLKQGCVLSLSARYEKHLIVDNAQAFYAEPVKSLDTFYSARKFFGVPDGAYLYTDAVIDGTLELDQSSARCTHLLKRIELGAEAGYGDFHMAEKSLDNQPIRRMSVLTEAMMAGIDYREARERRLANYRILETALGEVNRLRLPLERGAVPMAYPFMAGSPALKQLLISNRIYVATYWPNVLHWCQEGDWERSLTERVCFLPTDQRYGEEEMRRIVSIVFSLGF